MARRSAMSRAQLIVLVSLLLLVLGGAIPPNIPVSPSTSVLEIRYLDSNGVRSLELDLAVQNGVQPNAITALLIPLTSPSSFRRVLFYLDSEYPVLGDLVYIYGVFDHLAPSLRDRGFEGSVELIDASGLRAVLSSSEHPVIVMATTVIPSDVFGPDADLLTPWLDAGGTLVWTGDLIGGFSGSRGQATVAWNDSRSLGWEGEQRIFLAPLIGYPALPPAEARIPTPVATWLGLRYPRADAGARLPALEIQGCLPLGYLTDGPNPSTSISWIPRGSGGVLLFGHGPTLPWGYSTEDVVTNDAAQILQSGILWWSRTSMPGVVTVTLGRGERATATLNVTMPADATAARLYVYSSAPLPQTTYLRDFGLP